MFRKYLSAILENQNDSLIMNELKSAVYRELVSGRYEGILNLCLLLDEIRTLSIIVLKLRTTYTAGRRRGGKRDK